MPNCACLLIVNCVCYVQLVSMAANKTEKEFAITLGLSEEALLEAFEEQMVKKEKEAVQASASSSSGAVDQ